ncbi:MAG: ABC transporter ATP-binding protein [Culicoidibacterales bacterium]
MVMSKYIKKHRLGIIVSILLTGVLVAAMLLQPKLLATVLNKGVSNVNEAGIPQPNMAIVNEYGIYLIIIAVIGLVAGIINTVISAFVAQKIGAEIREDMFKKIQSFSYTDIENFEGSNLVVRMTNDVNQVQSLILMMLQQLIRIPLLFIGSFILAFFVFPSLWWIIVAEIVLVFLILLFINGATFPLFGKYQKLIDGINARVKDNFIGSRVVKSFVQETHEIAEFQKQNDTLSKLTFKIGRNFSVTMPLFTLIGNMAVVFAIYFAAQNVVGDMSILGDLISYTNYLFMIMMALILGGFLMMMAGRAGVSIKRINEVLSYTPAFTYSDDEVGTLRADIRFENVSFTYPKDTHPVLENVSFTIKNGQTVGIVGATGSGKSTLINLMARLFDPTSGQIYVGAKSLTEISHANLRNQLAIVLQRPFLFLGTVERNIMDGNLEASFSQLEQSAQIAQASEFIEQLEGRFDAPVQQRGANFSGGQKQRISIARGLIKNPAVLILDDSTSALDSKSEKLVREGLEEKFSQTTKIIVSQKISSVVHADQIIVLDEGRVDSIGTHKELVKSSKIYQEIFESQKGRD